MRNIHRVDNPTAEAKPVMQRRKAERPPVIYRPYQQTPNRVIRDRLGKVIRVFPRRTYKPNGEREVARRRRQIAAGRLTMSNGLVLRS